MRTLLATALALLLSTPAIALPRIVIDAGHGAPGNTGNKGTFCEDEERFTLRVAEAVTERLRATGRYDVRLGRRRFESPTYQQRLAQWESSRIDAVIGIHSDARGAAYYMPRKGGELCLENRDSPGFSLLYSELGSRRQIDGRRNLARTLAARMAARGFPVYDGSDYVGLHDPDGAPGVFIDRRRIFLLRKPTMPAVIVETHNALDPDEVQVWDRPETLERFADAVVDAMDELFPPRPANKARRRREAVGGSAPAPHARRGTESLDASPASMPTSGTLPHR